MACKNTPEIYQHTVKLLNRGKLSQDAIAKNLGVSQAYVSKVDRGTAKEQKKRTTVKSVQAESRREDLLKQYRSDAREYKKYISELNNRLAAYSMTKNLKQWVKPIDFKTTQKTSHEATAIAMFGDWHIDETVTLEELSGVNEFNEQIAERRVRKLSEAVVSLLELTQSRSKIDTLYLLILGDMMSGWIHDDLIECNMTTPPEALVRLFDLLLGSIDFILKHTKVNIIISGSVGNHTRITKSFRTRKRAQKSYEWILYEMLVRWYMMKNEKRIKFILPRGQFNWLKIYNLDIRVHHGDIFRYQGGVNGVTVPLNKAITQLNKARHADLDFIGHWHQRLSGKDFCLNGSLIGYSNYSEWIKADYERPQQSFCIIHPKYGRTADFPIILE